MKRSEALAILSRDHHHALVVAQKLRRADEESAPAARTLFLEYWNEEGRRHFQLEEELLLPAFAVHGDARHPLVLQVLGDHVAIRARAARLASVTPPPSAATPSPATPSPATPPPATPPPATPPTNTEAPLPLCEALHALGAELAAHVRLEERELFPVIEAAIPPDELLELAHTLDQA